MKELVEYIATSLVDNPDGVNVTETSNSNRTVIQLVVEPGDMGRVIGKQGRIAQAMRNLLKVAAANSGQRAHIQPVLSISNGQEEQGQAAVDADETADQSLDEEV